MEGVGEWESGGVREGAGEEGGDQNGCRVVGGLTATSSRRTILTMGSVSRELASL